MERTQRNSYLRTGVAALLACCLAFFVHGGPEVGRRRPDANVFADVKSIILSKYVQKLDEKELDYWALRGMISALEDPHSSFLGPEEAKEFRENTDNEFGGLGIQITVRQGTIIVVAPLEGTPAFAAGILPDDHVIAVDGVPCAYESALAAARHLRGEPGTEVVLTVLHKGATRPEEIPIKRAVIQVRSVGTPVMEDEVARIGYVRVTQFSGKTGVELREAVTELDRQGARALVLDLRQNPGGYLDAAIAVADLFLTDGVIVETRGRDSIKTSSAQAEGTFPARPLVVLINGSSASAAEIVAGALKDAGVAKVVGVRSYGKGSVQEIMPLAAGELLRLTTAHFYTRSGKKIHRLESDGPEEDWGIVPDLEVELDDLSLALLLRRRVAEAFRNGRSGQPGQTGQPGAGDEAHRTGASTEELDLVDGGEPVIDTQLEAALEYLRGELQGS